MMRRSILIGWGILFGFFALFFWTWERAEAPSTLTFLNAVSMPAGAKSKPSIPSDIGRKDSTLSIGRTTLPVELAVTEEERMLGLGDMEALAPDAGMLFVFPQSDFQGIWMKGMRFPLDIIWLVEEDIHTEKGGTRLRVIDMREQITPATYPTVFFPRREASYVLEMNGGAATRNSIAIGSVLTLPK